MLTRPRTEHLLAAAAFALACARGSASPMTSDAGFHLLRAGNELLSGSLDAYRLPPGGEHAPLLGAAVTAFGGLFSGSGGEAAQLVPGCLLLGAAAAAVLLALVRSVERATVLLGLALLLLPPAVVSSFLYRPDAALAGVLLLVALHRQGAGHDAASVVTPAWLATLSAPWTLPAAVVLLAVHARRARAWIAPAMVVALIAVLSWRLGPNAHGQILHGLLHEVTFRPDFAGSFDVLRRVWGGGILLLVPLLVPALVRETRPSATGHVAFSASAALLLLGADPTALRAGAAVLLPSAAVLLAHVADRLPDPRGRAVPHRPVLFALLLPLLLLLLGGADDNAERQAVRGPASRDAQIATFLREDCELEGDVLASRTGAIGALSGRAARRIPDGGGLGDPLPAVVVLADGLLPRGESERAVFVHPRFLARYTPLEFRRGRRRDIVDAVWVRLGDAEEGPRDYGEALLAAWEAEAQGDFETARRRYEDVVRTEPFGRARGREGLGRLFERLGYAEQAERNFAAARARDGYAVWARGHLCDRALARGGVLRADSLLVEMMDFNPHLPEVRATRARLFARAAMGPEALAEAEAAVVLAPTDGRVLANWGIMLWRSGSFDEARAAWRRAIRVDADLLRYLGDFEQASTTIPPPPPLPLFTDVEFDPLRWRNEPREPADDPSATPPNEASER